MSLINVANPESFAGTVKSIKLESKYIGTFQIFDAYRCTTTNIRAQVLDMALSGSRATDLRLIADTLYSLAGTHRDLYQAQRSLNLINNELQSAGIVVQLELKPDQGHHFLVRSTWQEN